MNSTKQDPGLIKFSSEKEITSRISTLSSEIENMSIFDEHFREKVEELNALSVRLASFIHKP